MLKYSHSMTTCKHSRFKCLQLLYFLMHLYEISGTVSINAANDLFNQKLKGDINALENEEPGFDYTEAEMAQFKIWPQGVIPYFIDTVSFDAEFRKKLDLFLESVNVNTGVQFFKLLRPPRDEFTRWVLFINRRGVLNAEGYTTKDFTNKGVQKVVLGYDSPYTGELYAIVLAILGIPPQNNAPDRDDSINVKFKNIMPDKKHLFQALKNSEWLFHDLDYDFYSAGHFGLHKYSISGHATIEPKYPVIDGIGDGQGFTYTDIWKIRMMYNYISKGRSKTIRNNDCKKMFKPGSKFNNYKPEPLFNQEPRPKPNKYLGKPDYNSDKPDSKRGSTKRVEHNEENKSEEEDFDKVKKIGKDPNNE